MKLFYASGTCSLSPHIVAHEAGIEHELQRVDLKSKTLSTGGEYLTINPKGYVPALQLDNGELLTEGVVIVQYLADLKPESHLAPPPESFARYRLQEMLTYISSELHKSYSPLFHPAATAETRAEHEAYLKRRYKLIEKQLEGRQYLFGDTFCVADAYLFTVTNWARVVKLDLSAFPNVQAFQTRTAARAAVKAAMRAEWLIK